MRKWISFIAGAWVLLFCIKTVMAEPTPTPTALPVEIQTKSTPLTDEKDIIVEKVKVIVKDGKLQPDFAGVKLTDTQEIYAVTWNNPDPWKATQCTLYIRVKKNKDTAVKNELKKIKDAEVKDK